MLAVAGIRILLQPGPRRGQHPNQHQRRSGGNFRLGYLGRYHKNSSCSFPDLCIQAYEGQYRDIPISKGGTMIRGTGPYKDGNPFCQNVHSSLGRFLFNEILDQDLGFVDRSIPGKELALEVDLLVDKKMLKKILEKTINVHGTTNPQSPFIIH